MKPSKEELLVYAGDRKQIAEVFGVSDRTVVRWLKEYDLFERVGRGKLNLQKARQIRNEHQKGASMKELASKYNVTFASISRVVHGLTYPEHKEFAKVSVVYNPR
jgi:transposase